LNDVEQANSAPSAVPVYLFFLILLQWINLSG